MMYYFVPKQAGRPIYSYRLSIVHFWAIISIYIWAGPHHLHYTALPDWAQSLGMVMSLILLAPSWGGMINVSITGTKQGLITAGAFTEDSVGNTYQEGHEDQVMVQGFNHEVIIPRDPQSGQPTGQRVHKPVVITKVFDKASASNFFNRLFSSSRSFNRLVSATVIPPNFARQV